jgi:hypothetical protein
MAQLVVDMVLWHSSLQPIFSLGRVENMLSAWISKAVVEAVLLPVFLKTKTAQSGDCVVAIRSPYSEPFTVVTKMFAKRISLLP